jgi:hypothetical protein
MEEADGVRFPQDFGELPSPLESQPRLDASAHRQILPERKPDQELHHDDWVAVQQAIEPEYPDRMRTF